MLENLTCFYARILNLQAKTMFSIDAKDIYKLHPSEIENNIQSHTRCFQNIQKYSQPGQVPKQVNPVGRRDRGYLLVPNISMPRMYKGDTPFF